MITGVRGSGKTVMLTDISKHFKNEKDWIVIELNPDRDMLQGIAAKLYDKVWSEMSNKDKKICNGIANTESGKIKDVRERLSLKTNEFNRKIECLKEIGEGVLSDFI